MLKSVYSKGKVSEKHQGNNSNQITLNLINEKTRLDPSGVVKQHLILDPK